MKTILCPTDFSVNAEHALKYGASLADSFDAKLILLHIYETPLMLTDVPFTVIEETAKQIREGAAEKMESLKAKLAKQYPSLQIETIVMEGLNNQKIVAVADKHEVEFIVMGTTGTSKLQRMLMGSTTAKVIRHANCPVLCIPTTATFNGIKKIVFATDLHEDNIEAARHISSFTKHFDAEIIFVFVDDKHLIHTEESIQRMTNKIRSKVKYPKVSGYIVGHDNVTKGIDKFLKKYPADVLAMFSHEKHFPGTMFSQSITTMMSHQTRVPLLALKLSAQPVIR